MLTLSPAAVTVALSADPVALATAVKVSDPLPVPLTGLTVNQLALDVTVHAQPAGATRLAVNDPPAAVMLDPLAVRDVTHADPLWLSV